MKASLTMIAVLLASSVSMAFPKQDLYFVCPQVTEGDTTTATLLWNQELNGWNGILVQTSGEKTLRSVGNLVGTYSDEQSRLNLRQGEKTVAMIMPLDFGNALLRYGKLLVQCTY